MSTEPVEHTEPYERIPERTVTLNRDRKKGPTVSNEQKPEPSKTQSIEGAADAKLAAKVAADAKRPRATKLEAFIQLAQSGKSVAQALRDSGILTVSTQYDPTEPDAELAIEDLYYQRCAARRGCKVIPDTEFQDLTIEERKAAQDRGDITTSQIYKLVDWLYFVKGLPLKAIAQSLQIEPRIAAHIKAELSNDFAKTIRMQSAEGYIADLLRTKDQLRADLNYRRSQIGAAHPQQIVIDRLIWELENKFVDRLQEIGIIDKNLGRMDVHEEWVVEIGAAGQPMNNKLKEIPTSLEGETLDAEYSEVSVFGEETPTQSADSSEDISHVRKSDFEQRLGGVPSATIVVEPES